MKRISVAIIGAGQIGARYDMPDKKFILSHAHAFSVDDRFELVGIVDPDSNSLNEACEFWDITGYESVSDLFMDHNHIDTIINTTPDELHYNILMELFEYNCSLIITEKPVTLSKSEALDLKNKLKKNKKNIILNHSRRFINEYTSLQKMIVNNEFGKFISGTGYYGKGLLHNGTHMIDLLNYFFDEPNEVIELHSVSDFKSSDLTKTLVMKYSNGAIFTMNGIDSNTVSIFEFDLLFENGRIKFAKSGYEIDVFKVNVNEVHSGYKVYSLSESIQISPSAAMKGLVENAYEVLNGADEKCRIEDGIKVLELWENLKRN